MLDMFVLTKQLIFKGMHQTHAAMVTNIWLTLSLNVCAAKRQDGKAC